MKIFLIGIFGLGGIFLRYATDTYYKNDPHILNSTLIVNGMGSLLAGILFAYILNRGDSPLTSALLIGLCGGLTTFSGFSLHIFKYLQAGDYVKGLTYLLASPILGLIMLGLGFIAANRLISLS